MAANLTYRSSRVAMVILPALLFVFQSGYSQTAAQTVTLQVSQIALLQTSGAVSATITGAGTSAGVATLSVANQTTTLQWGTNRGTQKITARLSAASKFQVYLQVLNPTAGVATPQILATTTAQDILLTVGRSQGSATISYTIQITADKGVVTDTPNIIFEMKNQ